MGFWFFLKPPGLNENQGICGTLIVSYCYLSCLLKFPLKKEYLKKGWQLWQCASYAEGLGSSRLILKALMASLLPEAPETPCAHKAVASARTPLSTASGWNIEPQAVGPAKQAGTLGAEVQTEVTTCGPSLTCVPWLGPRARATQQCWKPDHQEARLSRWEEPPGMERTEGVPPSQEAPWWALQPEALHTPLVQGLYRPQAPAPFSPAVRGQPGGECSRPPSSVGLLVTSACPESPHQRSCSVVQRPSYHSPERGQHMLCALSEITGKWSLWKKNKYWDDKIVHQDEKRASKEKEKV